MSAPVNLFLSSTGKDLRTHRDAVDAAIRKLDDQLHCVRMEDWGARPAPPKQVCIDKVKQCRLFVGILGHCYGSRPPDDDRSFTEIEYDTAVALNIPRLMFVAPDDFLVPNNARESDADWRCQQAFRARVLKAETAERVFHQPHELVECVYAALLRELPGIRIQPDPIITLPARIGDFTGRETELNQLCRALTSQDRRASISAIGGLGGVGKTTLAVEAAWRVADEFPDGVLFIDLRGFSQAPPLTPSEAMAAVIRQIVPATDRLPDNPDQLLATYRTTLANRRFLLLLDNARNLDQVEALVPPPPVALLLTSRHQLLLSGAVSLDLDVMPPEDAVALLREIMGADRTNDAQLALLAERCGRLPLALRAAGTYLKARRGMKVETYLDLLAKEKERLKYLAWPQAKIDVHANLSLSVAALEADDAMLAARWRKLAVFSAGFMPDAAAAVWESGADAASVALDELVARSLLSFEEKGGRYRLHDLVRDLAAERLDAAEREEVEARHAEHYHTVLAQARDLVLQGHDGVLAGLALFDLERVGIEAGQAWAARHGPTRDDAARLAYGYTNAGAYVLSLRLPARQRIAWLETALAACRQLGDRRGEGNALGNLGNAYANLGETRKAIEHHEQALVISREIGDRRAEGQDLGNLGLAYAALGEPRKAIELYEQRLVIARAIGDRRGEGAALGNLGLAWAALGETRKAIEHYEQCLVLHRAIGDRRGEGAALGNLGLAYAALGETRKAIEHHEQYLIIAREIGDRRGEGNALGNLGLAYADLGEPRKAIEHYEQQLVITREIGDRRGEGAALGNLGNAYAALGEPRKAIEHYEQQLVITREIGDRRGEGNALMCLAIAEDQLDARAAALPKALAALTIYRQIEDPWAKNAEAWLRDRGIDPDSPCTPDPPRT